MNVCSPSVVGIVRAPFAGAICRPEQYRHNRRLRCHYNTSASGGAQGQHAETDTPVPTFRTYPARYMSGVWMTNCSSMAKLSVTLSERMKESRIGVAPRSQFAIPQLPSGECRVRVHRQLQCSGRNGCVRGRRYWEVRLPAVLSSIGMEVSVREFLAS